MPQSIDELQVTNMKTKIDELILRFMLLTLFIIPVDSLGAGDEFKRRPDHGVVDGKSDHKGSILGDMIIVGAKQDNGYRNDGRLGTRLDTGNGSDNPETQVPGQSSVLEELGYILAMETVFVGMSYLASRKQVHGPIATAGFDLFMGFAGLNNASYQEAGIHEVGHYLISAGFFAKSLYNFKLSKDQSQKTRFLINFTAYNILVFTGYFLDSLR